MSIITSSDPELQRMELAGHPHALRFSPDGRLLVGIRVSGSVTLWRLDENQLVEQASFSSRLKRLYGLALSPDGTRLATVGESALTREHGRGRLDIWRLPDGYKERQFSFADSYLQSVVFSPDGNRVLAAGAWEKLHVVNLPADRLEFAAEPRDWEDDDNERCWSLGERNSSLVYHPDGRTVAITACYQGGSRVVFCELDAERETLTPRFDLEIRLPADELSGAAFSPDGRWLAFADWDLHLYAFPSQERIASFERQGIQRPGPLPDRGSAVVGVVREGWSNALFTPDGQTLICGAPSGVIFLWDVPSGEIRRALTGHDGGIMALALNPAGTRLVSSGYDKTLRLWRIGEELSA